MNSKFCPPPKESGFLGEMSEAAIVQDKPRTSHQTKRANAVSKTITGVMPKGLKSQPE